MDYIRGLGCDKWANVVVVALGGHQRWRVSLENMCARAVTVKEFFCFSPNIKKNVKMLQLLLLF